MVKINITILSENLKRLCHERGLTIYKLAKITGVSEASISRIINLSRQSVSLTTVNKLANGLRVHPDELFKPCTGEEYTVEDIADTLDLIFQGDELKINGYTLTSIEKKYLKIKLFENIDYFILLRNLFEKNNVDINKIKDIHELNKLKRKILHD